MGKTDHATNVARIEIWERVEEAVDTLRRMPDKEHAMLRHGERGQAWPQMIHTADEQNAWDKVPSRRPAPSKEAISRMDEVLDWLLALAKVKNDYFKAVWVMCGMRKGPVDAAKVLGCHRETATLWRDAGLDRIEQHRSNPTVESIRLRETLKDGMHHPLRRTG